MVKYSSVIPAMATSITTGSNLATGLDSPFLRHAGRPLDDDLAVVERRRP